MRTQALKLSHAGAKIGLAAYAASALVGSTPVKAVAATTPLEPEVDSSLDAAVADARLERIVNQLRSEGLIDAVSRDHAEALSALFAAPALTNTISPELDRVAVAPALRSSFRDASEAIRSDDPRSADIRAEQRALVASLSDSPSFTALVDRFADLGGFHAFADVLEPLAVESPLAAATVTALRECDYSCRTKVRAGMMLFTATATAYMMSAPYCDQSCKSSTAMTGMGVMMTIMLDQVSDNPC